ncbi:hypothetical protein CEP54_004640 [Fusarium duplospermum]|uniref:Uncharacterized protein n=1 Tax=Fusarium duplospermum TaxID=1325734 RepID=A0A428QGW0_9HYPO|nr:hypothetical protein CEP54_004640 [Fusarium duplospermum]
MSGKENDKKVDWTQEAKARIQAANAKSGNDPEFAKKAQSEADKAEHAKGQAAEQGEKK